MLTIKKEETNDKLTEFLKQLGYEKNTDDKIVMTAKDNDVYLGAGVLELCAQKVYLTFVNTKEDDLILKLGIIKSLLNFADLRGIQFVYGNDKNLESLYKMTRFKEEDGEFAVELSGYFTGGC